MKGARFDYADVLLQQLRAIQLPLPIREHRFDKVRRWRFDHAWPFAFLAVEIHGGEFSQGRHSRGLGMARDFEKLNAAQLAGWVVLHYTGQQVTSGVALQQLEKVLSEIEPTRPKSAFWGGGMVHAPR